MYNQFIDKGTKLINLTPTNEETNKNLMRKIEQLKKKNTHRLLNSSKKAFSTVKIKRNVNENQLLFPDLYGNKIMRDTEQINELLRMAKIVAFKSREFNLDTSQERDDFIRDYSAKISQFNLYTKINQIFNLFEDPNYNEPMFDKDYIGRNTSTDYAKSLDDQYNARSLYRASLEKETGINLLINPMTQIKKKPIEDLAISSIISRASDREKQLTEELTQINDDREKLVIMLKKAQEQKKTNSSLYKEVENIQKKIREYDNAEQSTRGEILIVQQQKQKLVANKKIKDAFNKKLNEDKDKGNNTAPFAPTVPEGTPIQEVTASTTSTEKKKSPMKKK